MTGLFGAKRGIETNNQLSSPNPSQFTRQVLQPRDLSHLEGIAAGIEQSATDMLSRSMDQLGSALNKGITTKALFDLEEAQGQNIDDFIDSRMNPQRAQEALENATQLQNAEHALWDRLGEGASVDDINHITEAYDREISKYKRANEQGVMSVQEFEARVIKTTREAIQRTPGLSDVLMSHAEKMLNLSGVRMIRDPKETEDNSEEKLRELIVREGLKRHIPMNLFNPDLQDVALKIARYDQQHSDWQAFKRYDEEGRILTDQQAQNFAMHGANAVVNGGITDFLDTMLTTYKEVGDYAQANNVIRNLAAIDKQRVAGIIRRQGLMNTPQGQRMIESYNSSIDELVSSASTFQSGAEATEFAKNKAELLKHRQELGLREKFDVSAINLLNRLDPFITNWNMKSPGNEERLYDIVSNLLSGAMNSPVVGRALTENNLEADRSDATTVFQQILNNGDPSTIAQSSSTLLANYQSLNANSPLEALQFMDKHVETLGNSITHQMLRDKDIPSSVIADFTSLTDEYITQVFHHKNTIINREKQSISDLAAQHLGMGTPVEIKAGLMDDGRLFYQSNEPKLQALLNNKIATRYNNAIKAYANLAGTTVKEASRNFYSRYATSFDIENESFEKVFGSSGGASSSVGKIIQRESSGDPEARNPQSSAVGLGQFIEGTWLDQIKKHRPDLMEGRTRQQVLDLRTDPEISKEMIEKYTEENKARLSQEGIQPTDGNAYLMYFLGPTYGIKTLKANRNTPIEYVVPSKFIKSNREVLEGKTVGQVIAWAHK